MTDNRTNEPTEAQIERAAVAMQAESSGFFSMEAWRHLARAALVAAQGIAPQDPNQNETKSGNNFVSLDPEKVAAMIRDDLRGGEYASAPDELPYAATSRRIARALCDAYTEGKLT